MTFRLTLGIDPGQSGAIAAIADGKPAGFIDMPTKPRKAGGEQVDGAELSRRLRELLANHSGAYVFGVIEQVSARPGQGGTGMFRFGQADGYVRGVLSALGINFIEVHPQVWKRYLRLTGKDKDAARAYVLERFPDLQPHLKRKKDIGRADALLIGLWAEITEQLARQAA